MDDQDPLNLPPAGVYAQGAEFQLQPGQNAGEYTVFNVIGMPPAWSTGNPTAPGTPPVFTDNTQNWPKATKPKTPKFSQFTQAKFEQDCRGWEDKFDENTRYLTGQMLAGVSGQDLCDVSIYQVPKQIEDDEDLLIIQVTPLSGNTNPDGSIFGHS
jgi:hypothetical protein